MDKSKKSHLTGGLDTGTPAIWRCTHSVLPAFLLSECLLTCTLPEVRVGQEVTRPKGRETSSRWLPAKSSDPNSNVIRAARHVRGENSSLQTANFLCQRPLMRRKNERGSEGMSPTAELSLGLRVSACPNSAPLAPLSVRILFFFNPFRP